jgi:hypothetical protein
MEDGMREQLLESALAATMGDRNKTYGAPIDNMDNIAELWNAYLRMKTAGLPIGSEEAQNEYQLTGEDIAWMNVLQKIARTASGVFHPDNYVDAVAYSAIAGECAQYTDSWKEGDE